MIGAIIVAVLILVGVIVGSWFLHKAFLSGEYSKIAAYSSSVLLLALAIIVAVELILAAVAAKKISEYMPSMKDRFQLTKPAMRQQGPVPLTLNV